MEHRWGERIAVRLTVALSGGSLPPVAGSLENVSSSGAFVRTLGRGPARGPVDVTFEEHGSGRGRSVRLPAYVVRETESGVGIEWYEFAPRPVRQLLAGSKRNKRAGGARARPRAQPSGRHSPRGPNTAMHPCVQSAADPAAIGTSTLPVAGSAATEWACGPVGRLPIQRLVLESTTPSTGPPVLATAAR